MKRWYLAWTFVLLGCFVSTAAVAAAAQSVRKSAEASMLVTGSVEVNPDGTLHGYTLDQPEKLPPVVVDVIAQGIAQWEFKLSAPTKDVVKSSMSIRIVAKPVGDGNFKVTLVGATFGQGHADGDTVSYKTRPAPTYPMLAIHARVTGTVYLLVRVGRDGTVEDVIAEQVNLEQYATPVEMDRFRKALADASISAVRRWTYNPPSKGAAKDDPYWVVRVPVNFFLQGGGAPVVKRGYGHWDAYIPGPRQTPPWISNALASQSPDAVPDGALSTGNAQVQLATRLDGA